MRSYIIARGVLLLMFLTSIPCLAQDFGWAADDSTFFPIGWTKDGTLFAYGSFGYSIMISNQSYIHIAVQNVITDEVVWGFSKNWDEGNVGEGSSEPSAPRSSGEAWELVSVIVEEQLSQFKIKTGGAGEPAKFPLHNGDELSVEIVELKGDNYEVRAVSWNLGVKTIFKSVKSSIGNELSLLGYFPNPDGSRIAVILQERGFSTPFPAYYVIGCHLRVGFKKTR